MEELVVEYNQLFKYIKETFCKVQTKIFKELKTFKMEIKVYLKKIIYT